MGTVFIIIVVCCIHSTVTNYCLTDLLMKQKVVTMQTLILYVIYVVYFDEATVNKKLHYKRT